MDAATELNRRMIRCNIDYLHALVYAAQQCPEHLKALGGPCYSEDDLQMLASMSGATIAEMARAVVPFIALKPEAIRRYLGEQDPVQLSQTVLVAHRAR